MSERGDFVTAYPPLEATRAALSGKYAVISTGAGSLEVRDELEKLICRVGVRVVPGDSFWLTLEPLRGYGSEAERIRDLLSVAGFRNEDEWKHPQVPMSAEERADVVVARVLTRLLEIQDANQPGALAGTDIEFLHDLRVAIRRTRSVLREMRDVFRPDDFRRMKVSLKWLQDQTSATRDLDVYLEEFGELRRLAPEAMRGDLDPIEPLLRRRQESAHAAMEAALTGDRARALHVEWTEILRGLARAGGQGGPGAARPIGSLAAKRIDKVHRKMVKMGRAITPESAPEQYHELRKKGKELRYLLELFAVELFDPDVVKPMIKTLKNLQDVLGRHQDREVQIGMLKDLGDELVSGPGGAGTLIAIGTLIHRLETDAQDAREQFASAFAEFASDAQCKLVSQVFG